jgi:GH15 family glucan-1,4-alpha-glucosidase
MHSAALVSHQGSIDWWCPERFDAPAVFAAILDSDRGGAFVLGPSAPVTGTQEYATDSAVLKTIFSTAQGRVELTDFMPTQGSRAIVRQLKGLQGTVPCRARCAPKFTYGDEGVPPQVQGQSATFQTANSTLSLQSTVPLKAHGDAVQAEFTLAPGAEVTFILRAATDSPPVDPATALAATLAFWREWCASIRYSGRWPQAVHRSAITLKLMTYAPSGAIVAAPTTSLPEHLEGERNWDYRYTWVRDGAFCATTFARLGLLTEAEDFLKFIDARAAEGATEGPLQIMYGIDGRHALEESELTHLAGYRNSKPVRIGNGAWDQLQLDIYGEWLSAVAVVHHKAPPSAARWAHVCQAIEFVCGNWQRADEGIWEVRGGRRHFVYSKLMCWNALERGLELATSHNLTANTALWQRTSAAIRSDILEQGFDSALGVFTQAYDATASDASLLTLPLTGFLPGKDKRITATLDRTIAQLGEGPLVYRYDVGKAAADGLSGEEGTFLLCAFWLVEALAAAGRTAEAESRFSDLLEHASPLGLYSEQVAQDGTALGNFPQAFSHLGVINAALSLDEPT